MTGSKARTYYKCRAMYHSTATCNKDPNCQWSAALGDYDTVPVQQMCYSKEVAKLGSDTNAYDAWCAVAESY